MHEALDDHISSYARHQTVSVCNEWNLVPAADAASFERYYVETIRRLVAQIPEGRETLPQGRDCEAHEYRLDLCEERGLVPAERMRLNNFIFEMARVEIGRRVKAHKGKAKRRRDTAAEKRQVVHGRGRNAPHILPKDVPHGRARGGEQIVKHRITESLVPLRPKVAEGEEVRFYFASAGEPGASQRGERGRHAFGLLVLLGDGRWVEPIAGLSDTRKTHVMRGALGALVTALDWLNLNAEPAAPPNAAVYCSTQYIHTDIRGMYGIETWIAEKRDDWRLLEKAHERLRRWPGLALRAAATKARSTKSRGLANRRKWPEGSDVHVIYRDIAFDLAQEAMDAWLRDGRGRRPGDVIDEEDIWQAEQRSGWEDGIAQRLRDARERWGL